MKYTVRFFCERMDTCQHCGQGIKDSACKGDALVTIEVEKPLTFAELCKAAGSQLCPFCGAEMNINIS